MNVSLAPQLEDMIRRKVAAGAYRDSSEVISEALRQMAQREDEEKLKRLQQEISIGLAQADRGEFSDKTISDIIVEARAEKYGGLPANTASRE